MGLRIETSIQKGPDGRPSIVMSVDKDGEHWHVGFYRAEDALELGSRLVTLALDMTAEGPESGPTPAI
jgi:hypothetical protein